MEMDSDEDDDTHLCLKCHLTITGLENYIRHRKIWCTKRNPAPAAALQAPPLSRATDDDDPTLEADDFFSSLELQSSTKKAVASAPAAKPGPSQAKGAAGVLTRSKATAVFKTRDQAKQEHVVQREAATEDLQVIEEILKSSSSAPTRRHESSSTQPAETDDDDSDLEIIDDADAPPRTHTGGKWRPGGHRSSPPSWSRQSSLGQADDALQCCPWSLLPVDRHAATPPPSHTGGKWKPQTPVHAGVPINPMQGTLHHFEEDDDDAPPPGHTSGKWAPGRQGAAAHNAEDDLLLLSPQKACASTIQYWCGPCNRRLSSKHLYDKHVKSGLHAKRTFQERELDEDLEARASHVKNGNVEITQHRASGKRAIKKPDVYANSDGNQGNKRKRVVGKEIVESTKKKRRKRKECVVCEVCKANVCVSMMGKHLASYYHRRKVKRNDPVNEHLLLANIHSVVRQSPFQCSPCKFFCNTMATFKQHWCSQLHIENDAKTSGRYWCSICKCVCETSSDMLEHFESEDHAELILSTNQSVPIVIRKPQVISCWTCDEEFQYNAQLRRHCLKTLHPDFNSVDDQSHFCKLCKFQANSRIAIQRHMHKMHKESAAYFCSPCGLNFATSDEALAHRRTPEHKYKSLADQKAKGRLNKDVSKLCQHCGSKFQNVLELKTHLRLEHPDFAYRCPHCGKSFALHQELSRHVRDKGCAFFTNPSKAGPVAARSNAAATLSSFSNELELTAVKCPKCPYVAESKADSIFHEILHRKPIYLPASIEELKELEDGNRGQIMPKYQCSLCSRLYRKSALLSHIHTHIGDQPYVCGHCDKFFFYRSSLKTHIKKAHSAPGEQQQQALRAKEHKDFARSRKKLADTRVYTCEVCGKSFGQKHNLGEHMKVHTGKEFKCDREDCIFRARSRGELTNHMSIHSDDRPHQCQSCSYAAKTKQQLKRHVIIHDEAKNQSCPHCPFVTRLKSNLQRHLRLHSDAKPFRCPYCQFSCNIFENMRKHVLTTSKHSGKKMYECKFCSGDSSGKADPAIYSTNLAKEFKVHLVNAHGTEFKDSSAAGAHISSIYGAQGTPEGEGEGAERAQGTPVKIEPKIVQSRKSSKSNTKKDPSNVSVPAETNDTSATSEERTEILSMSEVIYDMGPFDVLHQEIAETEESDAGPSMIATEGNPFLSGPHDVFHHRLLEDMDGGDMAGEIIVLHEEEIDVEIVQASDDERMF